LRQGLLAQFGCSPSARRQRGQFADLFARHDSPPFLDKGWRRGQESNLPRLLRTDNGFEDREDHQAPFTLREDEKENVDRSEPDWHLTSSIERRIAEKENVE
jgi:hypothetical protein